MESINFCAHRFSAVSTAKFVIGVFITNPSSVNTFSMAVRTIISECTCTLYCYTNGWVSCGVIIVIGYHVGLRNSRYHGVT